MTRRLTLPFTAWLAMSLVVGAPPATPGVIKKMDDSGALRRITGKAKVINAHIIAFEDGTEVDLNGTMDAPELGQRYRVGDSFQPWGREAADFLRKLLEGQSVTFLSFGSKDPRPRGNAYAGEVPIQETMVRNGWAFSSHSGQTTLATGSF